MLSLVASLRQSTMDGSSPADEEHEDYLLLYETAGVSEHFKTGLAELASTVWTWKRIIWAYDLLTSERKTANFPDPSSDPRHNWHRREFRG